MLFWTTKDRIGRHFALGPTSARLHLVFHPAMWAGCLYICKKLVWLREINYRAIAEYKYGKGSWGND